MGGQCKELCYPSCTGSKPYLWRPRLTDAAGLWGVWRGWGEGGGEGGLRAELWVGRGQYPAVMLDPSPVPEQPTSNLEGFASPPEVAQI